MVNYHIYRKIVKLNLRHIVELSIISGFRTFCVLMVCGLLYVILLKVVTDVFQSIAGGQRTGARAHTNVKLFLFVVGHIDRHR